ncbi:hypothetical protein HNR60_002157 [Rhodopseudomonas rhenobacensis]|uniref:DUF4112 domain-containing protein n=1 Tax=Rhodopseudomonas rhenobacensis TaxID=87461 RepID=A0A7W8DZ32_9BRAD|nr:DUF4112 domain-containing protein [Rhodopseudomonas rhenobacensis]MBB5047402.1 hypothetical protein [Rhodopseudomonas rhenobacensis]
MTMHQQSYSGPTANARRKSRAPIIDQDGREIPRDTLRRAPFDDGGFDFQSWRGNGFSPLSRAQRLARLEALAKLLDVAFILPGTKIRYGLDGLIGLLPVVGDVITTAISLWIVREARELGAPWHITARMLGNVALDGAVGVVPLLGDAFDVMFRANVRNMRLLRRWIDKQR